MHLGIGENRYYGGNVDSSLHIDLVIYEPTYELDGRLLVEKGKLLV